MQLRRTLIFCVFLCVGQHIFAQKNPVLEKKIQVYFEAMEKPDFDLIMSMTYPKLFTLAPKSSVKQGLESVFNNPQIGIRIDSTTMDSLHRMLTHNAGQYIKIDYSFLMVMKFKSDSTGPVMANRALPTMKSKYGAANTRVNPLTNELVITRRSTMVAIKNALSKDWTFIELKDDDPLSEKLLGQELLTKLEQY